MMNWTRVNGELMITDRQRSGYAYRIRGTGASILIAEGPISGPSLPLRREECPNVGAAMMLADRWESACRR